VFDKNAIFTGFACTRVSLAGSAAQEAGCKPVAARKELMPKNGLWWYAAALGLRE
jgi:hypothetical protein